mmetsp:Transcript_3707/g.10793  ORF Transcript_3707/g.10793 Transcript_3707/m.10793 type:complete len:375 (-) Transcript_3707:246-1370(-)
MACLCCSWGACSGPGADPHAGAPDDPRGRPRGPARLPGSMPGLLRAARCARPHGIAPGGVPGSGGRRAGAARGLRRRLRQVCRAGPGAGVPRGRLRRHGGRVRVRGRLPGGFRHSGRERVQQAAALELLHGEQQGLREAETQVRRRRAPGREGWRRDDGLGEAAHGQACRADRPGARPLGAQRRLRPGAGRWLPPGAPARQAHHRRGAPGRVRGDAPPRVAGAPGRRGHPRPVAGRHRGDGEPRAVRRRVLRHLRRDVRRHAHLFQPPAAPGPAWRPGLLLQRPLRQEHLRPGYFLPRGADGPGQPRARLRLRALRAGPGQRRRVAEGREPLLVTGDVLHTPGSHVRAAGLGWPWRRQGSQPASNVASSGRACY